MIEPVFKVMNLAVLCKMVWLEIRDQWESYCKRRCEMKISKAR